jgi:hypothetical protein
VPSLRDLYNNYQADGLVVIGQHIGDDTNTSNLDNLQYQMKNLGITYIVIQDLSQKNWYARNSQFIPTYYLIDRQGYLRYKQVGGGNPMLEQTIITLLNETSDD